VLAPGELRRVGHRFGAERAGKVLTDFIERALFPVP